VRLVLHSEARLAASETLRLGTESSARVRTAKQHKRSSVPNSSTPQHKDRSTYFEQFCEERGKWRVAQNAHQLGAAVDTQKTTTKDVEFVAHGLGQGKTERLRWVKRHDRAGSRIDFCVGETNRCDGGRKRLHNEPLVVSAPTHQQPCAAAFHTFTSGAENL
jgi:hypothetical protein